MALKQDVLIPAGINLSFKYTDYEVCTKNVNEVLEDAYIKIINQNGNKNKIYLNIGIYDKKDGNLVIMDNFEFIPDISSTSKNFLKQGYEHLKANKYTSAIDLLDEGQSL